jgi:hypothetical protein
MDLGLEDLIRPALPRAAGAAAVLAAPAAGGRGRSGRDLPPSLLAPPSLLERAGRVIE